MRIAVIGLGLIGGSIALAARERLGAEIWGVDRDPRVGDAARARGLVDHLCATPAEAVSGAEAAFIAVPVGAISQTVAAVLKAAPADCVVTDVGSVKRAVVASHQDRRFVGGHPLAGSEHSGLRHVRADMFEGAIWYLTPVAATSRALYERLRQLLEMLGAHPQATNAALHDRLLATVSHLPHVFASALVSQASATLPSDELAPAATGPSFRDATRVAGAASALWTDIYLSNADLLAVALQEMIERLDEFREALLAEDPSRVGAFIASASAAQKRLAEGSR